MAREKPKSLSDSAPLYLAGGVAILTMLLVLAYEWKGKAPRPRAVLEPVRIAINAAYAGSCPIFVAQEKGYFAIEGVVATLQPHTSGKAALDSALQGQADLATVADVPVMFAAMRGEPVAIVATLSSSEKDHGIVGSKDKGVSTPADLKGKRIGVSLGTSGQFFLDAFLIRQKLTSDDVTARNFKPEELAGALASGEVDAVAAWQPYLEASLDQLGDRGSVFYGEGTYELAYNIAGKLDYVASHPEAIQRVLRAVIRGSRLCQDSSEAAQAIVGPAMKADAVDLKRLWPSYRFRVSLDQSLLLALEDQTRWAIRNNLTGATGMPNYLNVLHLDALRAVAPGAVTVIH